MNYLAHAYLSFGRPEILVGNMISDFVKGKKKYEYSQGILKGIELHRDIDTFTDDHAATKLAKQIFVPYYGLYSGAFIDVLYDYFLANDKNEFQDDSLFDFSQQVYANLDNHKVIFPEKFQAMYPYMKKHNWLFNYKEKWGIKRSLEGLVHRAAYLSDSETAFDLFEKNIDTLESSYNSFFPELKEYVFTRLEEPPTTQNMHL